MQLKAINQSSQSECLFGVEWVEQIPSEPYLIMTDRDLVYYQGGNTFTASKCYQPLTNPYYWKIFAMQFKRAGKLPKAVVDGTLGWGRDALCLALAGVDVLGFESQLLPLVFLDFALKNFFPSCAHRLNFVHECFSQHQLTHAECVYLDPLYFDERKSKSKKAMELLYDTAYDKQQQRELLELGLARMTIDTLIMKLPAHAPRWFNCPVLASKQQKVCRLDFYYFNERNKK